MTGLFIGKMPVVAVFALVAGEGIDGQAMLILDEARRIFGGFFVGVANLLLVVHPAFFWLIWLWLFHGFYFSTEKAP